MLGDTLSGSVFSTRCGYVRAQLDPGKMKREALLTVEDVRRSLKQRHLPDVVRLPRWPPGPALFAVDREAGTALHRDEVGRPLRRFGLVTENDLTYAAFALDESGAVECVDLDSGKSIPVNADLDKFFDSLRCILDWWPRWQTAANAQARTTLAELRKSLLSIDAGASDPEGYWGSWLQDLATQVD